MSKKAQLRWTIGSPWLIAPAAGIIAGFSAPGFEQWYLAWCGLAPLFLVVEKARKWWHAAVHGWLFGLAFNLVWLSWFLKINLPPWVGIREPQQMVLVGAICWLLCGLLYGTATSGACVAWWSVQPILAQRKVPQVVGLVVGASVFTAVSLFLADKPDLLFLPLTALEYTQYRNQAFIQIASVIGGAGLQFILVLQNMALAAVASAWRAPSADRSVLLKHAGLKLAMSTLVTSSALCFGATQPSARQAPPDTEVSIFQCGFMQDVMRTGKGVSASEVISQTLPQLNRCPSGLVVWTETSLPMPFNKESGILEAMRNCAKKNKLDIVFGIEETAEQKDKAYNAAAGISANGEFADAIYRKQYLIPFGEFEPLVLRILPQSLKKSLNLPDVPPFLPGTQPEILKLSQGEVAPLICGENVEAMLCARSIRAGGMVIANISNLSWFQESILGDQTIAIGTIRAVENRRYYIYAADTGPSFVIDQTGALVSKMNWMERGILRGKISYLRQLTPFTRMTF
ncbi:MAG: apolipoprotein N-acyltransferase [Candidatus Obscuribacterales bacterium]|nr:apolipoprotein N-acyltransferase [Candidatus Obscuribacterales bacterium]